MPSGYECLRVRLFLSSPWALPYKKAVHPLHLDALLVAALTMQRGVYPRPFATDGYDPNNDPFAPGNSPDVPLGVAVRNGIRVYQASAAMLGQSIYPEVAEIPWIKRAPTCYASQSNRNDGWSKTLAAAYQCLSVLDVAFYCVGDADAITKLLATIRGIGPGRQIGLGQIAHFAVERMPQADPETWGLVYNGLPARYLPVAFWPEGEQQGWRKVYAAARPPYWHPALRTMCWAPGAAYTLPSMGLLLIKN